MIHEIKCLIDKSLLSSHGQIEVRNGTSSNFVPSMHRVTVTVPILAPNEIQKNMTVSLSAGISNVKNMSRIKGSLSNINWRCMDGYALDNMVEFLDENFGYVDGLQCLGKRNYFQTTYHDCERPLVNSGHQKMYETVNHFIRRL